MISLFDQLRNQYRSPSASSSSSTSITPSVIARSVHESTHESTQPTSHDASIDRIASLTPNDTNHITIEQNINTNTKYTNTHNDNINTKCMLPVDDDSNDRDRSRDVRHSSRRLPPRIIDTSSWNKFDFTYIPDGRPFGSYAVDTARFQHVSRNDHESTIASPACAAPSSTPTPPGPSRCITKSNRSHIIPRSQVNNRNSVLIRSEVYGVSNYTPVIDGQTQLCTSDMIFDSPRSNRTASANYSKRHKSLHTVSRRAPSQRIAKLGRTYEYICIESHDDALFHQTGQHWLSMLWATGETTKENVDVLFVDEGMGGGINHPDVIQFAVDHPIPMN